MVFLISFLNLRFKLIFLNLQSGEKFGSHEFRENYFVSDMNLRYRHATFHTEHRFSVDATLTPLVWLILLKTVVDVHGSMGGCLVMSVLIRIS